MGPAWINKIPSGLLGFLGIKNGGQNPTELSQILVPTVSLRELYELQGVTYSAATSTISALGATLFGIPGSGATGSSFFHTLNFGVAVNCTVGTNIFYQIGTYRSSQAFFTPYSGVIYADSTFNSTVWTGVAATDVWTGPDEQLCIFVHALTGTPGLRAYSRSIQYPA